ncbi:type IV secretion protein Rhs [Pantoea sp. A4]|uniref:type IV secretion protein Rhs n=1 Tax=Pantoea sp. A4 TaxID=1225184 RepID=UPI000AA183A3|nr:type IV secretion protein Rhs [Pantoea sp. A4]
MSSDVCKKPKPEKEGSLRLITLNEIAMAKRLFGNDIAWNRVWIHCDSYFPFGFQSKMYAMSPNGELWFRKESYQHDFSCHLVKVESKHTFIHELAHVWQHQQGQFVRLRGLMSWAAEYTYDLRKRYLKEYTLE